MIQKQYLFEDKVQYEYLTAQPNTVWAFDFTSLDTKVQEFPNSYFKVLMAVDHATNQILGYSLHRLEASQGTIKAAQAVAFLRRLKLKVPKLTVKIIVHTDRGPEFLSKQWYRYVNDSDVFQGSTSLPATPTSNAVIERVFKTFKRDYNNATSLPSNVATVSELRAVINRRIRFLNQERSSQRSLNQSPVQFSSKYECTTAIPPSARKAGSLAFDLNHQEITQYKEQVSLGVLDSNQLNRIEQKTNALASLFSIQRIEAQNAAHTLLAEANSSQDLIQGLHNKLDVLLPKAKKKHIPRPLRREITTDIIDAIISSVRLPKKSRLAHSRFVVTSTILYYTGMRLHEAGSLTEQQVRDLFQICEVEVYISKGNKYHIYRAPQAIKIAFKAVERHVNSLFFYNNTVQGELTSNAFNASINASLRAITKDHSGSILSHSFRIGCINKYLRARIPIEKVSKLIGHASIASTEIYTRLNLADADTTKAINDAYKLDS